MNKPTEDLEPTRQSLLARLRNWEDQASWLDFFTKYWRLIYNVARRSGLSDADAQEVVQETIITVCKSIRTFEYEPKHCLFRSWLLLLTQHRIVGLWRKRKGQPDTIPLSAEVEAAAVLEGAAPERDLDRIWAEEWERNLVITAAEHVKQQVKAKQFQIYDLHVLQHWPVKRVAETLKVSLTQVYIVKHRVGRLMRRAVQAIEHQQQHLPSLPLLFR